MAAIFPQSSTGQIVDCSAGGIGQIAITEDGCTFQGSSARNSVIVNDGSSGFLLSSTSTSVKSIVFSDLTFDGGDQSNLTAIMGAAYYQGLTKVTFRRCTFIGYPRGAYGILGVGRANNTDTPARVVFRDCYFSGDGIAIETVQGMSVSIVNTGVRGGMGGFIVGADGFTSDDISILRLDVRPWYWAAPAIDTLAASSFTSNTAVVTGYNVANHTIYDVARVKTPRGTFTVGQSYSNSSARKWDRVETTSAWSQVIDVDTVTGNITIDPEWRKIGTWRPVNVPIGERATLYRISLGKVYSAVDGGATQTLLIYAGDAASGVWRKNTGGADIVPSVAVAGTVLEICRVGTALRVVDTGGIHLTAGVTGADLRYVTVEGGWSDCITMRGNANRLTHGVMRLGQDMGGTNDGNNTWDRCVFQQAGNCGMANVGGSPTVLSPIFDGNGTQGDGAPDVGFHVVSTTGVPGLSHPSFRNTVTGNIIRLPGTL